MLTRTDLDHTMFARESSPPVRWRISDSLVRVSDPIDQLSFVSVLNPINAGLRIASNVPSPSALTVSVVGIVLFAKRRLR